MSRLLLRNYYIASSSSSPVLILMIFSIGDTKIFPSPIFPVFAASLIILITLCFFYNMPVKAQDPTKKIMQGLFGKGKLDDSKLPDAYTFDWEFKTEIKSAINKNVNAKVEFKDVTISLFRHFPNLSVGLKDFSIVGLGEFAKDTLVSGDRFDASVNLLAKVMEKFKLSGRGYHRILRVARTIADLDQAQTIEVQHLSEAVGYRKISVFGEGNPKAA